MTPIDLKADLDKVIRDIIFIPQTTFYGLFLSEVSRIFNFGKSTHHHDNFCNITMDQKIIVSGYIHTIVDHTSYISIVIKNQHQLFQTDVPDTSDLFKYAKSLENSKNKKNYAIVLYLTGCVTSINNIITLTPDGVDQLDMAACLAKHSEARQPIMMFNPDHFLLLTENQKRFIVLHECLHYIDQSFILSKEFGMESPLDNIAMDMSINSRLLADACKDLEFIPEGILPSSYPSLKLENCQSSLYYYNKLKEAKNNFQQNGTTGDQNLDDLFNSIQNDEPCNNPNHSTWEELTEGLSDIEKEILKRTITKRLQEIAEDCRSMGNGSVPSNINLEITKIERKVNWKSLLRKFIGTSTDSNLIQNRNRPSKRFETNPSNKIKYKTAGVFLMDSSGSVSDDELLECNSELYHLHKAGGNIRFASWDGECEPTVEYSGKLECNRTKAGGTNIDCAIAEVNANYLKYKWNFAIITTDGHIGGITLQCKIPLLIVITKKGTKDFRNPYNNKVIQIN